MDDGTPNSNDRRREKDQQNEDYVTPQISGKNGSQKKKPYVKLDPRVSLELSEDGSIKNRSPSSQMIINKNRKMQMEQDRLLMQQEILSKQLSQEQQIKAL